MTIAKKILEYRAKNNLSQEQFAKLCNISVQTVYSVEAGYQKPRATTLGKILNVIERGTVNGNNR